MSRTSRHAGVILQNAGASLTSRPKTLTPQGYGTMGSFNGPGGKEWSDEVDEILRTADLVHPPGKPSPPPLRICLPTCGFVDETTWHCIEELC